MGNNLENLSAKELKVIAESMGLVKGEDFQANASAKDMLELINNQNGEDNSNKNLDGNSQNLDKNNLDNTLDTGNTNEGLDKNLDKNLDENKTKTPIVVTPVKRNGKIYKKGDKIDYFDGMEKLINDGIIKLID